MQTRSAHLLSIRTLAALTLAYGDREGPLDKDARAALENAIADLRLIQAWDDQAQEKAEAA